MRHGGMADQVRALILAGLLAALAGMVDAIGYLRLSHLFVSYMSGNSTQFAIALGKGDFSQARAIILLIALFVLGAAGGQLLAHLTGRRHLTWVLIAAASLLAAAALFSAAPEPMVLAMGALNASMHRAGRVGVSLTYVTGTLVKLGQGLGDYVASRAVGWDWLQQAAPWVGLVAGAAVAGAAYLRIGAAAVWIPVVMAGLLALWSAALPQTD